MSTAQNSARQENGYASERPQNHRGGSRPLDKGRGGESHSDPEIRGAPVSNKVSSKNKGGLPGADLGGGCRGCAPPPPRCLPAVF